MARARSKTELLKFSKDNISVLHAILKEIAKNNLQDKYVYENRRPKDIIAHLVSWHELMNKWYETGMNGENVEIPAPGYTFKDTPKLNEELFQKYKDIPEDDILAMFEESSKRMMSLINNHTDEELFEKKKYLWTGSTSMGSYFASATSSHYDWANKILKKFIKVSII